MFANATAFGLFLCAFSTGARLHLYRSVSTLV